MLQYNTADENDPCKLYIWIHVSQGQSLLYTVKVSNKKQNKKNETKTIVQYDQTKLFRKDQFKKTNDHRQKSMFENTSSETVNTKIAKNMKPMGMQRKTPSVKVHETGKSQVYQDQCWNTTALHPT